MEILINTDHNISGSQEMRSYMKADLESAFERFSEHLTRLEVKISDENASKEGENDKKCVLEARLKGMQPIAVTGQGNSIDQAVTDATNKMKNSLDSVMGKLRSY
ncbi:MULTISPECIES: HPF/RaiA family ribosome-associated protein [unclassified Kaistella]|uniref:HPF/RaiA family ribosome-associated protein n=1 Tax=unclassified Kaistella TaxID=2762626 RepID=UPI002736A144|nr:MULTISPECIES: HPF/RaiA family ribosome-associated protein [unclassified Kaistella]MCZ2084243.1 HPF/RaiA family ribosome-associated protein [Flavobacteriales bacterium]MDP2453333.1 HPF/RaiA family ribosome-associated protein [Kaistella sp. SH11-4b]MDP2456390.1 HPF/RaiA family ribosome-associated protein [Kaistella sp. SH40-3]MDP2459146.1 HPF/RaiA family ribosome-associated protein [Kaistella sp. SH19-2b]